MRQSDPSNVEVECKPDHGRECWTKCSEIITECRFLLAIYFKLRSTQICVMSDDYGIYGFNGSIKMNMCTNLDDYMFLFAIYCKLRDTHQMR